MAVSPVVDEKDYSPDDDGCQQVTVDFFRLVLFV